jgi:DNA polymerase-3 subunit alpha
MAFVQIEDESGVAEAIFFPKTWANSTKTVIEGAAICVEGKISRKEARGDAEVIEMKILADSCNTISDAKLPDSKKLASRLMVAIPAHGDRGMLQQVKEVLEMHPGTLPVSLLLPSTEGEQEMKVTQRVNMADALYSRLVTLVGVENVRTA